MKQALAIPQLKREDGEFVTGNGRTVDKKQCENVSKPGDCQVLCPSGVVCGIICWLAAPAPQDALQSGMQGKRDVCGAHSVSIFPSL